MTITWLRTGIQKPSDFLKEQNLKLSDDNFAILRKEKITSLSFLDMSKDNFKECGLKIGLATLLTKEATYKLEDDNEELVQCIKEIKRRLENMGSILTDSNEAMRCEYISTILHASLYIVKRITSKEITLAPKLEVVGEESTGQVDYAIKALKEFLCIMEGKLHQNRKRESGEVFGEIFDYIYGIFATALEVFYSFHLRWNIEHKQESSQYSISESALKEGSEEEKDLRKNVKRIMEVIVG
ncbi:hypothetical protein RhiirA4_470001 [Rhizophagus irregularis]|uniref:SAM domain-containing protein n=1 Tax=Rhizophagus irregularis TaxID=588596 RepID=A0A2I1H0I7_9GLOM|nr:hypothetical protein RhiirA4_470001 [Rhizophagus irregularis]